MPFQFVSASDGTNVVKVFQAAIMAGKQHKDSPPDDYFSEVMALLGDVSVQPFRDGWISLKTSHAQVLDFAEILFGCCLHILIVACLVWTYCVVASLFHSCLE